MRSREAVGNSSTMGVIVKRGTEARKEHGTKLANVFSVRGGHEGIVVWKVGVQIAGRVRNRESQFRPNYGLSSEVK